MEQEGETFTGRGGETYRWYPDRPLGHGGFGQVFEATTVDGLLLAVKRVELRRESTSRWYADARGAERELQVAARLASDAGENVMPVLDELLTEDELLLVMPRADHSLADLLAQGRVLNEGEVRVLLLDLATGLRLLAEHGVVHRDIKPGNVLRWNGRWVLADLGIARILDVDTSTFTWAGTGTHEYWAPELFAWEPAMVSTDLYALGCVAFAALTGGPPFEGEDLAQAHRTLAPDLPPLGDAALERTIRRLLAKDPGGRPADARMVQQLLEPRGALGDDQTALLRAAARATRREDEQARQANADRERAARVRDGLAALDAVCEDALARAQDALPESALTRQTDSIWLLMAQEAGARLVVQAAEPSAAGQELLIGTVRVDFVDSGEQSFVANLLCDYADGRPSWRLAKYAHNYIAPARPPLGPRKADDKAGLSLHHLDGLLADLAQPGVPVLVADQTPLTAAALLAELGAELDAAAC
jgi:hypothetical protein